MPIVEVLTDLSTSDAEKISSLMPDVVPQIIGDINTNLGKVIANEGSRLIVAREAQNAQLIGFLVLNLLPKVTGLEGRINDFVVEERERRKGVGTSLLQAAFKEAQSSGAYKVEVAVSSKNTPANLLHESLLGELTDKGVYRIYL
jgi:ribosomal protein S18 acetylase RimI-like enzyme